MPVRISPARGGQELGIAAGLFRDYATELGEDLSFQSFEDELARLPGEYAPPEGEILLAWLADDTPAGCVAVRPLAETGVCEMKRMYVPSAGRGKGVGRLLVREILSVARAAGYHTMKLDTLPRLKPALHLYTEWGFVETEPYYDNPIEGVLYLEVKL